MDGKYNDFISMGFCSRLRWNANAKRKLTLPLSGANFKLTPFQSDNFSSLPSLDSPVVDVVFADKAFLNLSSFART